MEIFGIHQILCLITLVQSHSDPFDGSHYTLFDDAQHIPGEPLTPIDYQNGDSILAIQNSPPSDKYNTDPIELAGLFEGDIILSSTKSGQNGNKDDIPLNLKNGIKWDRQKWDGGIIPYFISNQFNAMERSVIAKAFSEYHKNTCIRFVPRTTERDYIQIIKGSGCSSLVGRAGNAQPVTLGNGCVYNGVVIHELMHAVGFWHEQSRWDRDEHVTVFFNNIQSGMEFNFRKYNWNYIQNLSAPYDLSSVMHYGPYAFSRNRRSATILPKDPNKKIGQRNTFSKIDIYKINRLYKCNSLKPTQPPTIKPTTSGECIDNHKHCNYWANNGECSKNKVWMLANCKKSCKVCDKPCDDLNQYCGVWARRGECSGSYSVYMNSYCSKSCKACKDNGNNNNIVQPSLVCEDEEKYCAYWASRNECTKNPRYMAKYCPKSCHLC